ncbi:MAG: HD domain-containing protein [Proteobacteria bacterium]|nr:HD domain-containing protein [Pseudomonadota bacterium]
MGSELRTVLNGECFAPLWQAYMAISRLKWRDLMLAGIASGMSEATERLYLDVCRPYFSSIWGMPKREHTGALEAFLESLMHPSEHILSGISTSGEAAGYAMHGVASVQVPDALDAFLGLDHVVRTGWTRVIPAFADGLGTGVETVDEHSVKTAFLAGMMAPEAFGWAFLMGLVHDHAELVVGDLTPGQVRDRRKKMETECSAYGKMLDESGLAKNITARLRLAFFECMEDRTRVAHCVHIADKLDMAMQAMLYERQTSIDLEEFLDSSESVFRNYMPNGAI